MTRLLRGSRETICRSRPGDRTAGRVGQTCSQDLDTGLCHEQSVLKLSRALAVNSDTGPVVGPCSVLVCSETDHGLNGEAHAGLGHTNGLVLCVVRDVGCAVEQSVDTVTAVSLDSTATSVLGVLCNDGTVLSE